MSTGLECYIVEQKKDQWFYILERYDCPKGCWSWLDYADAYGPFASEETAKKHLYDHHANPGGHSVIRRDELEIFPASSKEKMNDLMKHPIGHKGVGKYGISWA